MIHQWVPSVFRQTIDHVWSCLMVLMFLLGQSLFSWAGMVTLQTGIPPSFDSVRKAGGFRCLWFLVTTSWELPLIGVAPQTSEVTIAELCRVLCSSCKGSIFSIWVAWDWVRSKRLYRMMCRQGRNSHQDQDTQVETAAHLNSRMIPFRVKLSPLNPFSSEPWYSRTLNSIEFLYHFFINMDLLILELTRPRTLVSNQLTIGEGMPIILQLLAVYCIIHVYCLISFAHAGCLCNITSLHHHFYM